jgi:hypothetical protein
MLKILRCIFNEFTPNVLTVIAGIVGYFISTLFLMVASLMQKVTSPDYVVALLITNFEIGAFYYLGYLHPILIPLGWSVILILATLRKRISVVILLTTSFVYSIIETGNSLGRSIRYVELVAGFRIFLDPKSSEFVVVTLPLIVIMSLTIAFAFRRVS